LFERVAPSDIHLIERNAIADGRGIAGWIVEAGGLSIDESTGLTKTSAASAFVRGGIMLNNETR
jgi:hypothetical protein